MIKNVPAELLEMFFLKGYPANAITNVFRTKRKLFPSHSSFLELYHQECYYWGSEYIPLVVLYLHPRALAQRTEMSRSQLLTYDEETKFSVC